jgi:hypothetical protein
MPDASHIASLLKEFGCRAMLFQLPDQIRADRERRDHNISPLLV